MVALTKKETAEALKDEIHRLGGFVISVPGSERIRLQFLLPCDTGLQKLKDLGFEPVLCSYGLRFERNAAVPCGTYEINLPAERQEIPPDSRAIPKDDIGRRKKSREVEAMLEAIYGKQKR